MAASLLEEQLSSLQQCLTSGDNVSKAQTVSIVSDIYQICIHEVSDRDLDLCCSVLFAKEKGLITFLIKTVTNEEYQTSKQKILELLYEFIQKIEKKALSYALDIKDVCMSLFFRERLAKVKNAALPVLVKIIQLSAGSDVGKDLGIDKIVKKFFMELTKSVSKLCASVRESIYILLGVVAEIYPEHMTEYAQRLVDIYLGALKTEMTSKTKKPELSVIAGCLEGLTSYLVNFTQSAEEGSKHSFEIFKYARMAIDPNTSYTRYDVPKTGLHLFSRHASQFNIYLVDDYEDMYGKFRKWSQHHNREMLHLGMLAMEAFLSQVSQILVERAQQGQREGGIFKFFIHQFRDLMNNSKASAKELSLAVRGYGLLAAPCRTFLQPSDVHFMFSEMMTKSEQQYLSPDVDIEDRVYSLPSYLEAISNIVKQVDHVSETYATSLERLMLIMVENLPSINDKMHFLSLKSILLVLLSVMPKGGIYQQMLSSFVFQALIRTCSHPPVIDTTQTGEDPAADPNVTKVTYKNYIDLWSTLLNSPMIKEFSAADISLDMRKKLTEALYDELLNSVLKILDKLDLTSQSASEVSAHTDDLASTSTKDESVEVSADPLHGIQPNKPKDFLIFINLVDFCRDFLPGKHCHMFERWIFTFCHTVILQSTSKPLVSGYYKLLAVSMKIANKLNYFTKRSESMDTDDHRDSTQQRATCYQLMKKFSKEVLVRMKQYRDDLLASCLTYILSIPKEIVSELMYDIVPAIQLTLDIGLSYLPLAMVALDALEYWAATLPKDTLEPHYSKILPHLDPYLRTGDQGSEEVSVDDTLTITKNKPSKGRKKLSIRLIYGKKKEQKDKSYENQLSQLKQRVIRYLGSLGGSINYALLANAEVDVSKQAVAWDTEQHLKFDMPFIDMKPTIFFDSFLPHIVTLATRSSDRQTKVAACELLHSLILLCIGRSATQPGRKRHSMAPLYSKLFPSMLQLACDVDLVPKQLFEPLLMQLIHWLTNNKMSESEETMSLLDAIYDGIIQPTDTGLRDFSARCLKEFLQWSIKQTKNVEKSPINAKSLLKRLYSYALHPAAFKRLGAALAFNNIYTVFREDAALVNLYTFQILVHFVESLALAHADELSLGTQDQCRKTLEHLERIIQVKADVLRKEHKARTEPKQWSSVKLDIAVRWLLRQCGRPQTECRHLCMKLVHQLCPLISGIKSTQNYFQTFYKSEKAAYFITRFESGEHTSSGLQKYPRLTDLVQTFSVQSTLLWFDMLLAPLDCYTWVFGENLLSPTDLFSEEKKSSKKAVESRIFQSIQYFLENIALAEVADVTKLFERNSESNFFTPREMEDFNKGKCTVIVRMLYFLSVMLGRYKGNAFKVIPSDIFGPKFWRLICLCVVQPGTVGFNLGNVEVMKKLPGEMELLLTVITKSAALPAQVLTAMKKEFGKVLQNDMDLQGYLSSRLCDPGVDSVKLQQLLAGYGQLHKAVVLQGAVPGLVPVKLAQQLFEHVYHGMVVTEDGEKRILTLSPTVHITAKALLNLAFQLGLRPDAVVKAILDQAAVQSSSGEFGQSHGDLFFSTFKSTIATHIVTTAKDILPLLAARAAEESRRIISIMVAVVDHVSRNKDLRKQVGGSVVTTVLEQWKPLTRWWSDTASIDHHSMALLLLTKLVLLDSQFVTDPGHPSFSDVFHMYLQMVVESKTNLAFKCRVLELLPFFVSLPDPHQSKLKNSLNRLVADNFPLKSSEFEQGSSQYKDYTTALDRILTGLELSGSEMLLELLISIYCREKRHIYDHKILESISRFTKRLPRDKQKSAVNVAYSIFTKESSYPAGVRRLTVKKVILPVLRFVHKTTLVDFLSDHMSDFRNTLETKLSKGPGLENQLITKLCSFEMLEVAYCRLTKEEIFSKSSKINDKFCQAKKATAETGKEMTQVVMKTAHEAKGEDIRGETTLLDLRREYHCAAYNLLISILSCTQTDPKFYVAFIFKEDEAKGQFVYDNIVDKEKTYDFPAELKAPLARKKQFVLIRNEVKEQQGSDEDSSYEPSASVNLASQYLADSSLHEDYHQYDFTATPQLSGGSQFSKYNLPSRKSSYNDDDSDIKVTVEDDFVELEMDDLNEHECMANMIALLKHMQRTKITPAVESGIVPDLPPWMKYLHDKMKNSKTHINVRLFIGKLITNTAEIFRPYAKHWLRPICQLILGGTFTSINYFVTDLVVTMMSWHKVAIPQDSAEEKAMSSRLVEFLTNYIYSETRPVFRNNLDLLRTLLVVWKERIQIPYQIIYKHLKTTEDQRRDKSVGLQIMGVVLSAKLPPYGPSAPVDQDKYFSVVAQFMRHDYKTVYAAAAEVVGLIFKHLAEKEKITEGQFHDYVAAMLTSVQQAKPDNFIMCIHRLQRHYPPLVDRFLNKLLFLLPNLHGEFRSSCLEIILTRVQSIDNVFLEMKSKGLMSFLSHRDEDTQLTSLKIVKAVSSQLKPGELSQLLPLVTAFSSNPSTPCRNVMYELLMWVYDNYREEDDEEVNTIMQQTKESLLRGLGDDDLQCRLLVQNFWSSETRLPTNTLDRLVAMLEAMYSPVTEQQFLSYSTNLVLEMTSKSPDYQREIFEHPLEECKFQDFNVKSSWKQRHVVMTPLFASTLASQSMDVDGIEEDSVDGQIRATQDVQQFTATQDASRAPYNWLTGSSLDTFTDYSRQSAETSSSLLFSVGTADMAVRTNIKRQFKPPKGFGKSTDRPSNQLASGQKEKKEEDEDISEMRRLKRRYLKDRDQAATYFARKHMRLEQMRANVREEQKTRRENQVTMYRKYRKGDLPDIQIKFSYIIAPLQALANRDSTISKLLFGAIFKAIFEKMEEVKTEREVQQTIQEIKNSLNVILSTSTQYFPPFINCILDVLYELRNRLDAEAAVVGSAAVVSNLQPLGICVLEEQLIQEQEETRPTKRGRTDTLSRSGDVATWIELSRLYKSVNEYDVLQGIFCSKIGTQEITQKATELEARGDYHQARKLYEEAMSKSDWPEGKPPDVEIELWDDCRMECLDNLTQWKDLEEVAMLGVTGDMKKVWDEEDTFYMEHYLPYIIRSKMKLMLQGGQEQQSLLTFIDSSMTVPDQKALIESRFCEELAMMYIWQFDYDRARHYTNMACERFLQDWSNTDTLMLKSRINKLQKLQPLLEMHEFLDFMNNKSNFTSPTPANHLVARWNKRSLHTLLDPVNIWDDIITNRNVFLDHITNQLTSSSAVKAEQDSMEEDIDIEDMFLEFRVRLKLKMVESCCHKNNHKLALNILSSTRSQCKETGSELLQVEWSHLYAITHHSKVVSSESDLTEDSINSVLSTIDRLEKYEGSAVLQREAGLARRHFALYGEAFKLLSNGLLGMENLDGLGEKNRKRIQELSGAKKLSTTDVMESLVEKGYMNFKKCPSHDGESSNMCQYGMDEAYLTVSKYSNYFLKMHEDEEFELSKKLVELFPDTVVVCLLKAIKYDSLEARQRFPRLLQLVEIYPNVLASFIKQSKEVPSWMFIIWISQMMALLDKAEAPAVHYILASLCKDYPQAVIYPFKLSNEGYRFGDSKQDKKNMEFVEELSAQLKNEQFSIVSKFISALEQMGQPDQIFTDWKEDTGRKLRKRKIDKKSILLDFQEMYKKVIEYSIQPSADLSSTQMSSQSASASFVEKGKYPRRFADRFKKDIESRFGRDGSKLTDMTYKPFMSACGKIQEGMRNGMATDKLLSPPETLKEYCQWLSDFNPNTHGRGLEIPGQYDGLSKPMPEYHVKITGFDQRVLVMTSIRKPKRITIRGNDEREYNYLVKSGEDLRQDQRVEQLFYLMNQVLDKDPACRQRKLKLRTYQVIPMTPRVGLIEWMNNTLPLKDFLRSSLREQEVKFINGKQGPAGQHGQWIMKLHDKLPPAYMLMYQKYSKTDTKREFQKKESAIPWDLSRRAFQRMSTSPEAFHVLRCKFAVSHALICICQYILGIGDRHLSNFMINLNTGEMIGIDFGHAFGSATQFLPIPELMPFRLTRQIRNIMMPLQVKGFLESTMIHSLRALRKDCDLLLNTLDIFVKEPSLDWLMNAEKQMQEMNDEDIAEVEGNEWYPKEKIRYVKRKLKGDNPCFITRDELELGHAKKPAYRSIENVLMGEKRENARAQLPASNLTVEQQVTALIDQATDQNILGRVYAGWEPWM